MKVQNRKKAVLILMGALVVIQAIWFSVVQHFVNKGQVKTTATVIRVVNLGNTCDFTRRRSFCDSSDLLYPVYEYYDVNGTRFVKEDRYLGEFKKNNPLRQIFGKDVGDKVTAFYTKDKPEEVSFMGNLFSYAAWLAPLYFVIIIAFGVGSIYLLLKLRSFIPRI